MDEDWGNEAACSLEFSLSILGRFFLLLLEASLVKLLLLGRDTFDVWVVSTVGVAGTITGLGSLGRPPVGDVSVGGVASE